VRFGNICLFITGIFHELVGKMSSGSWLVPLCRPHHLRGTVHCVGTFASPQGETSQEERMMNMSVRLMF
jgi:hypothetical protein